MKLNRIDPGYIDPDVTEKDALADIKKLCKRLRKLQASLYCERQRSVLIVLQALDTAGKDGVINHVLGAMNPLSCRVASFKKPGPEAAAHNYLWRVSILLPEKGEVLIFNRSHYEDVLVVKVCNGSSSPPTASGFATSRWPGLSCTTWKGSSFRCQRLPWTSKPFARSMRTRKGKAWSYPMTQLEAARKGITLVHDGMALTHLS